MKEGREVRWSYSASEGEHAMTYVLDPDLTSFMPGVIVGAAMKTT